MNRWDGRSKVSWVRMGKGKQAHGGRWSHGCKGEREWDGSLSLGGERRGRPVDDVLVLEMEQRYRRRLLRCMGEWWVEA